MAYVSKGTYWAIKNALTKKEKEVIAFYELEWFVKHRVPTVADVAKACKIPQTSVNYYLSQRKLVVKALNERGIPWAQHSQTELTSEQVAVATVMMNFADTRSNDEKLDALGVNPTQYQSWLRDPQFKTLIDSLADQNLVNIRPTAVTEFSKKIQQGDWNAIRYWFETTGELDAKSTLNPENFMMMIIEILQRHVKDPEVLMAIAQDIKMAAANRTLEAAVQPAQLTVDYEVHEPDLEEARRKLGV